MHVILVLSSYFQIFQGPLPSPPIWICEKEIISTILTQGGNLSILPSWSMFQYFYTAPSMWGGGSLNKNFSIALFNL